MRISEIITSKIKAPRKVKVTPKRKAAIKGPYVPSPKPLPKPKPLTPTPLQMKQRQQKNIQAYAKAVQRTLTGNKPEASQRPAPSIASASPLPIEQHRTSQEMEAFMKHVRGENLGKPSF